MAQPFSSPLKTQIALASEAGREGAKLALTPFEQQSIQLFVDAATLLGVPKSVAMIYGVLFGSAEPLSFAEIVQKLDLSKGSVSQGLRVLRDVGAIKPSLASDEFSNLKSSLSGGTGSRYQPVVALRVLLSRILVDKIQPNLQTSAAAIDGLSELLPESPPESDVLDARLRHLRAWQKRFRDLLPILKTFLR